MTPQIIGQALYGADPFVSKWVNERIGGPVSELAELARAIGFMVPGEERLGAGVTFFDYSGDDITVGIAIADRRTVTREMIDHCCRYPFKQLGVRRVTMFTKKSQRGLRNIAERIGFVHEGTKRGTDILMYGLLASDAARWIREFEQIEARYGRQS